MVSYVVVKYVVDVVLMTMTRDPSRHWTLYSPSPNMYVVFSGVLLDTLSSVPDVMF